MAEVKITFFNENRKNKCKTILLNPNVITMLELKKTIVSKFYKKESKKLISDLEITKVDSFDMITTQNFFDEQFDNDDAYNILSKYNNSWIYYKDLRYSIHVDVFGKNANDSFDFPLAIYKNYEGIINLINNKFDNKIKVFNIFKNSNSQIQIFQNADIRQFRNNGLKIFLFPICVKFCFNEETKEVLFTTDKSMNTIRSEIKLNFKIKTNDFLIQVNDELLNNDDDVMIYDILKRFNTETVRFDISLKSEIKKAKKILRKEIEEDKKSLNDQIKNLKKEIQNKDEEIQKLKEENLQLKRLKSLKKNITSLNEFTSDEYQLSSSPSSLIGYGTFSNVYKVSKEKFYAMKQLNQKAIECNALKRFIDESKMIFELRHPCIIRIHGFNYGNDEHAPSMILTLEPQSLENAINAKKNLNQIDKCRIAVEIVLGMRYIHKNKIIHRDLKPNNILLSRNNHVRICDFGIAKIDDPDVIKTNNNGTPLFMAPELFSEDDVVDYDNKIDVYAFGYVLLFIVTGKLPSFNMKNKLPNGKMPNIPKNVCKWVNDLILSCFAYKAMDRPSFDDIFVIMKNNNFNIFSDENVDGFDMSVIENRIEKIEAFEFLNA